MKTKEKRSSFLYVAYKKCKNVCLFFSFLLFFFNHHYNEFVFSLDAVPYTSAIVVDAKKGEVLYSHNADEVIYPASLTKMMTAYVVFDAVKSGALGLNDKIKTAENSTTISDLLFKMAVRSSNYPTDILATEVSGSVKEFVMQMNLFAKKMNMKNTHFSNTHGLYDKDHYSTARDIALLAIRMVYDFPKYADFFSITNYIDEQGRFEKKTSDIQQNVRGIEGSKTGFIDASGYNLAVWGRYGKKHLFVVVIGADSKVSRDGLVIKLINDAIGSDIAKTNSLSLMERKNTLLYDCLSFMNIDLNNYTAPVPLERNEKKSSLNKTTSERGGQNKFFYKNKKYT